MHVDWNHNAIEHVPITSLKCVASGLATILESVHNTRRAGERHLLLCPLVFPSNLIFFFGCEVVLDIERLSDLFGRLALDHVGNRLTPNVEQSLDVKIVCGLNFSQQLLAFTVVSAYQNDLEQHFLIDLHELLIPLLNLCSLLARVGIVLIGGGRVMLVMMAPFNDFLQDGSIDVGNGNGFFHGFFTKIGDHVLDED